MDHCAYYMVLWDVELMGSYSFYRVAAQLRAMFEKSEMWKRSEVKVKLNHIGVGRVGVANVE